MRDTCARQGPTCPGQVAVLLEEPWSVHREWGCVEIGRTMELARCNKAHYGLPLVYVAIGRPWVCQKFRMPNDHKSREARQARKNSYLELVVKVDFSPRRFPALWSIKDGYDIHQITISNSTMRHQSCQTRLCKPCKPVGQGPFPHMSGMPCMLQCLPAVYFVIEPEQTWKLGISYIRKADPLIFRMWRYSQRWVS